MAKVGKFTQLGAFTGSEALSTTFADIAIVMPDRKLHYSSMFVHVDTIAAGATALTMRITSDAGGDICAVTDTDADISTGIATATDGSCVYKIDIAIPLTSTTIYVWLKTDAGTCKCNALCIASWE